MTVHSQLQMTKSSKKDFSLIDIIYKAGGHHIFMNSNFKSEIVSGLGKY